MRTYILSGKVLPERSIIGFSPISPLEITLFNNPEDHYITLHIYIDANQITVRAENVLDETDIFTLRNVVKSTMFNIVNCYGYVRGYAYEVEITKLIYESGGQIVFGIDSPSLAARTSSLSQKEIDSRFNQLFNLTTEVKGLYFERCLNDCAMALLHPEDTAFYCYRALESLKQYFGYAFSIENNRKNDVKQWKKMAEELSISESRHTEIQSWAKIYAFQARHGVPRIVEEEQRIKILNDTWNVIDECVLYMVGKGIIRSEY